MHSMRMPALPSGVWTHVASFLSVKDAARLSGQDAGQVKWVGWVLLLTHSRCQIEILRSWKGENS